MNKVTLYQKNSGGKIKVWAISVEDLQDKSNIIVEHGQLGGKIQITETIITEGKNIGKANATTHYTQAVADAKSEVDKKVKKGYVYDIDNIPDSHILGSGIPSPMLAHKFDPTLKIKGSKNLDKLKMVGEDVATQYKLDGTRCFVQIKVIYPISILIPDDKIEIEIQLYSRSGDKYYNFPHIVDAIKERFSCWVISHPNVKELWLDGELYTHNTNFNDLSGLIRAEKRTEEDLINEKQIKFFIYDTVSPDCYSIRFKIIKYFVDNENIILTPTFFIHNVDHDSLTKKLKEAEENKYEGLMIRRLKIGYEHKRTWQLMKYKSWVDDEYEIIGFKKSITGETLGSIEFKDTNGNTFFAVYNGTDKEQKQIWDNKEKYLGIFGTVKYQNLTEDTDKGVPRFGKCIKFRKGPSLD